MAKQTLENPPNCRAGGVVWLFTLALAACAGAIDGPAGPSSPSSDNSGAAAAGLVASGRTGPRRLTNLEYDNTVRDLLGTELALAKTFVAEELEGFDNVAAALGMTPSQYESYLGAAETLARELFADDARRSKFMACTPSGDDGGACLGQILDSFGTRAFRRPLEQAEIDGLRAAYGRARAMGESETASLEHVLVAMLASPAFLYRSELSASNVEAREQKLESAATRPLNGYELASRLSYFLWSTLPDDELFALAERDSLTETDVLVEQLARMLDDPRASTLIDSFAAQWLGLRDLEQHKVLAERYPEFDDALKGSMLAEARAYIAEFLFEERPMSEFLSAQLNFVDERLAALYGVELVEARASAREPKEEPAGAELVRIDRGIGERRGYLGLSAFLTVSSFAQRTSPTLRAKWVLEELLCSTVPPPPPNVAAQLEDSEAANAAAAIENVRARLELHRSDPKCAGCHAGLDPIGLALESFDAIGRSRTHYENGDPVDTRGTLLDGTSFAGPMELSQLLSDDPRFLSCVARKLLTYALGRSMEDESALVEAARASMQSRGGSLRSLIEALVLSEAFRSQLEGESTP